MNATIGCRMKNIDSTRAAPFVHGQNVIELNRCGNFCDVHAKGDTEIDLTQNETFGNGTSYLDSASILDMSATDEEILYFSN